MRNKRVYNKLVRDRIPERLKRKNIDHKSAPIKKEERKLHFLFRKLREEVTELEKSKNKQEYTEELADLYEVLEAVAKRLGIKLQAVRKRQKKKRAASGGFEKMILLYWTR